MFRTRFNLNLEAEERESTRSFSGSFSANRTTEAWKVRLGVFSNHRRDTFDLTDSEFTNVRTSSSLDARVIKSVGEHVGLGVGGSAIHSTFRNQDLTLRAAPAVEYNVFPYGGVHPAAVHPHLHPWPQRVPLHRTDHLRPAVGAPAEPRHADLVRNERAVGRERTDDGVLAVP